MGKGSPLAWVHLDSFGPPPPEARPEHTILVLFEPEVVAPYWYDRIAAGKVNAQVIVTHRSDWARAGGRFVYLKWPQVVRPAPSRPRDLRLVMINARKYPTRRRHSLYAERERVAAWFARHDDIALFGAGWGELAVKHPMSAIRNVALRRVARGRVESKAEALGRAEFALCFENMVSPGYRTEKLFDCLSNGAVPIYWGDPEIDSLVPPEAFVDYRRFGSPRALAQWLHDVDAEEVAAMREAGRAFLNSPSFEPYTVGAFASSMSELIVEVAGGGG